MFTILLGLVGLVIDVAVVFAIVAIILALPIVAVAKLIQLFTK